MMLAAAGPARPEVITPPPVIRMEPAPAQGEPAPEAVAEAMKLFAGDTLRDQMLAGMMIGLNEGIEEARSSERLGPSLDEETANRLRAALLPELQAAVDAELPNFRREAALIYARNFTLPELQELNALNQRPVYRKLERLTPILMMDVMQVTRGLFAPYEERLRQRGVELGREMADERERRNVH